MALWYGLLGRYSCICNDYASFHEWQLTGLGKSHRWAVECTWDTTTVTVSTKLQMCGKKKKTALEKGARYWFYLWTAGYTNFKRLQSPHGVTTSQTKPHQRPHRRKLLLHHHHHRTKDAFLKCGFISCIRVRYRFSCTSCKHAFFHWQHTSYLIFVPLLERGGSSSFTCALFDSS